MKATFGNEIKVEVEGGTQIELFENIATAQEIFGITECGACHSKEIRFVVRKVTKQEKNKTKEYRYHELHCQKCRARLAFGLHQEGSTMFPKRKDETGNYLPNNGWSKYEKPKED